MTEENENKEEITKPTDDGEGIQSETTSELDRADQIAERQKRENDRLQELLERQEALKAREVIGGRADSGQQKEKPTPETDEEFVERFESGQVDLLKQ